MISTNLVVPITGAYFMEASFVTVTFPIEINSIKLSSESFLSQFLEVSNKFIEFILTPIFFHGEICAPRRQSKSNCNTFLLESGQVRNESLGSDGRIVSIKAVWEEPCLLLSTSICVILARVEPTGGLINFDISNHCNLVDWSL